jgi:uncharacterized protein YbjT (DUF2867 family)
MSRRDVPLGVVMQEKRRLLITGATGFIGQHLVPALAGHGHKVIVALRRPNALSPSVDQVLIKDLADGVDWDATASRYRRSTSPLWLTSLTT